MGVTFSTGEVELAISVEANDLEEVIQKAKVNVHTTIHTSDGFTGTPVEDRLERTARRTGSGVGSAAQPDGSLS